MKFEQEDSMLRYLVAILCTIILIPGETLAYSPQASVKAAPPGGQNAKLPPDQLDSLVAPIALYPDPLLAQVLAASTYPLEIVLLQRWLEKNKNLKSKQLADAASIEPWDPSVQALAPVSDVVKLLGDNIQWTTDFGNAFLAQEKRFDGCCSAHAEESAGQRHFAEQSAADSPWWHPPRWFQARPKRR
jgi:hypothetical protein